MSRGDVLDASQYMTPVGTKNTWNAASPIAMFSGGGNRAASAVKVEATRLLPRARPPPLARLPSEYTVPRCSGGLTSAMRANQFGEFADVSARATSASRNGPATLGR